MKAHSDWQEALVDINRSTEFTGDDVDQFSKLVDLGVECSGVVIEVPTITSSTISIHAQRDSAVATVPKAVHRMRKEVQTSEEWVTTASTTARFIHCDCLGGVRYIRIKCGTNQAADRSFQVMGTRD